MKNYSFIQKCPGVQLGIFGRWLKVLKNVDHRLAEEENFGLWNG